MISLWLVVAAIGMFGLSGLLPYLLFLRGRGGQILAGILLVVGTLLGLSGIVWWLVNPMDASFSSAWLLPWGQFSIAIDDLSAWFLVLIFLIPSLGAIYGLEYWKQSEHPDNSRRLGLAYGLLAAGMGLVAIARDGVLFLLAWEIMALAAFFASTADDNNPEVRRAGWIYLIATHIGSLCLWAMFSLWAKTSGSFALLPSQSIGLQAASGIFVLGLIGFGFKAGLMPLHVWLPGAHANAPSHVSALMSGVMLKMGIYGIIRLCSLLPIGPQWWGISLLLIGLISGIAGIATAIGQRDIKRILAYSSIENIGIIAMGLGLALVGRSSDRPEWVVLGLAGALLHIWNHGLFKPLLFFGAGSIIHASHTRDIEHMGGLAKLMPRLMPLFLVGALSISALPPFNGFVGEWLIYLGFFHTLNADLPGGIMAIAASAAGLALIGTLALACFVKLHSTVFLGVARFKLERAIHDPGPAILLPMAVLAFGCIGIGIATPLVQPLLGRALSPWLEAPAMTPSIGTLAPLAWISWLGLALIVLVAVFAAGRRFLPRGRQIASGGTWDCGYAQPNPRMQYTGSSFTQTIARLFNFALQARRMNPGIQGEFPRRSRLRISVPDLVLDRLAWPLFRWLGRQGSRIHYFQQGQTQVYLLYVLVITIILLVLSGLRGFS